jgi:hypothetical protein
MFKRIFYAFLPCLLGFVSSGQSATLNLSPTVDTYVDWGSSSTAYGASPALSVGMYSGKARRTLMHFDLAGIPDEAVITSAQLSLYAYFDNSSSSYPVRVGGMNIEVTNSLTANNCYSATFNWAHWGELSAVTGAGWKTWNLLQTGNWNYSGDLQDDTLDLYLKYASEPSVHDYTLFHSMNWDGGNPNYPHLAVEYVPIPGAALLLGSGLIGLVGLRRKLRN